MEVITTREAAQKIRETRGKLFSVTFIKRSTGSPRRMTARLGVRKGVTGAGKPFNASDHHLLTVCEFVSVRAETSGRKNLLPPMVSVGTQFRHVSIEGIRHLKISGKEFAVRD